MPPVTAAQIADYLGIELPSDGPDLMVLTACAEAVSVLVPNTVPRVRELPAEITVWPQDVQLAALMQGARLFTRRRSPTGIATYTETGAVFTPRWDPDIEKLLNIGKWAPPTFG